MPVRSLHLKVHLHACRSAPPARERVAPLEQPGEPIGLSSFPPPPFPEPPAAGSPAAPAAHLSSTPSPPPLSCRGLLGMVSCLPVIRSRAPLGVSRLIQRPLWGRLISSVGPCRAPTSRGTEFGGL